MRYLSMILAVLIVVVGCGTADPPPEEVRETDPMETSVPADTLSPAFLVDDIGTITYQDIEGGFYGIVAEDGTKYHPGELEEEFQQDGLRVRFRGYIIEDELTAQMWGKSFAVQDMMALQVDY